MKRTPLGRRTALARRTALRSTGRLRGQSDHAREQAAARRRNMLAAYGPRPWCAAHGIIVDGGGRFPICSSFYGDWVVPVWAAHGADDVHEPGKRSHGADPTDPNQAIPLCRAAHRWIHDHPAIAVTLLTVDGRRLLY